MPYSHPEMLTWVDSIEYDFNKHEGKVHSPQHSPPDMQGSIDTFTAIDAEVEQIEHFNGTRLEVTYTKRGQGGKWRAFP